MSTLNYIPLDNFVTFLQKKHNLTTLIETGTYEGSTTAWAAERFDHVITIDIRADYQFSTKSRCKQYSNIDFILGDSRLVLPKVISQMRLKVPALFWLDAHAVAPTLFGDKDDWPILEELDAINASPIKHYILIDDAHCFLPNSPHNNVPPILEILERARAGGYALRIAHDIIALVPAAEAAELEELGPSSHLLSQARIDVDAPLNPVTPQRFSRNLMPKMHAKGTAVTAKVDLPAPEEKSELDFPIVEFTKTAYGYMIIPRYDTNQTPSLMSGYALTHADILTLRPYLKETGPASVLIDIGCNVGVIGFGLRDLCATVHMFEPQRIIANMVCGSIAMNGWMNVHCYNVALGNIHGMIEVPQFDYSSKCSFGSIEFGPEQSEEIEQARQHDPAKIEYVDLHRLDDYNFPRVDIIKIDVEGMEQRVIDGALDTINRCRPILFVEHFKSDKDSLYRRLVDLGYYVRDMGNDYLCT